MYLILISIDFYRFISPFFPQFYFPLRRYIQHSRQCLNTFPSTSKFVKNPSLLVVFSTLCSVFGNLCGGTRSFVFDILHGSYNVFFITHPVRIHPASIASFCFIFIFIQSIYTVRKGSACKVERLLREQVSKILYLNTINS